MHLCSSMQRHAAGSAANVALLSFTQQHREQTPVEAAVNERASAV